MTLWASRGVRLRSRRARKVTFWAEGTILVFALIDLLLAIFLARRGLALGADGDADRAPHRHHAHAAPTPVKDRVRHRACDRHRGGKAMSVLAFHTDGVPDTSEVINGYVGSPMYTVISEHNAALITLLLFLVGTWVLRRSARSGRPAAVRWVDAYRALPPTHRMLAWLLGASGAIHVGLVLGHEPSAYSVLYLIDAVLMFWLTLEAAGRQAVAPLDPADPARLHPRLRLHAVRRRAARPTRHVHQADRSHRPGHCDDSGSGPPAPAVWGVGGHRCR